MDTSGRRKSSVHVWYAILHEGKDLNVIAKVVVTDNYLGRHRRSKSRHPLLTKQPDFISVVRLAGRAYE